MRHNGILLCRLNACLIIIVAEVGVKLSGLQLQRRETSGLLEI